MKGQHRGFIAGLIIMALVMTLISSTFAIVGKMTIDVDYTNINVKLNGKQLALTDASGLPVEPFAYNGTTYLPVRAISNALGLDVDWEQSTSSVLLASVGPDIEGARAEFAVETLYLMESYRQFGLLVEMLQLASDEIMSAASAELSNRNLPAGVEKVSVESYLTRAQDGIDFVGHSLQGQYEYMMSVGAVKEDVDLLIDNIFYIIVAQDRMMGSIRAMGKELRIDSSTYKSEHQKYLDEFRTATSISTDVKDACVNTYHALLDFTVEYLLSSGN